VIFPILDHRLKLATVTLERDWKFPKKWYNYFIEKLSNGYFTNRPKYREKFVEIFRVYRDQYRNKQAYFNDLMDNVQKPETVISVLERYALHQNLEDIAWFLEDFDRRF
nr:hypothetical protein [Thermotogota bacterium]